VLLEMEVGEMVVGRRRGECLIEVLGSIPELGLTFFHF
jgi:hypothetical protein